MLGSKGWAALGISVGLFAIVRFGRAVFSGDKRRSSSTAHTYVLETRQMIPAPIDRVFPLFEDPHNLGKLTPARMGFEILNIDHLPMQRGTTIEYRIKPFGVPQRWGTEIQEYESGERFVDLQTRGPYRYWRHQHSFKDDGGRTLMRDRVEYQMPLGLLGRFAHALVVAREVRRIFDYRADAITQMFGPYHDVEI